MWISKPGGMEFHGGSSDSGQDATRLTASAPYAKRIQKVGDPNEPNIGESATDV
jgi:hypothetical protein